MPAPKVLSGTVGLSGAAVPVIVLRSVVRAFTASTVEVVRFNRHGALCSTSAAMAPMCGLAAEVPKKGAGKLPAPEIETPSMAIRSGLVRPSSVGPRLLKTSAVVCDVSRHDSSGALEGKFPAAAADAEQMAPTETTLTGEPPASDCADTLCVAVL